MENRIARVFFNRTFLHNGVAKDDLNDIIQELPEDATLIGMYEDLSLMTVGLVFHSKEFKITPEGEYSPIITPIFEKHVDEDGVTYGVLERLDMSDALDPTYRAYGSFAAPEETNVVISTEGSISTRTGFVQYASDSEPTQNLSSGYSLTLEMLQKAKEELNNSYFDMTVYGTGFWKASSDGDLKYVSPYAVTIPNGIEIDTTKLTASGLHYVTELASPESIRRDAKLDKWRSEYVCDMMMEMAIGAPDCDHDWEHYDGFTQKYEFCKKCDTKKNA